MFARWPVIILNPTASQVLLGGNWRFFCGCGMKIWQVQTRAMGSRKDGSTEIAVTMAPRCSCDGVACSARLRDMIRSSLTSRWFCWCFLLFLLAVGPAALAQSCFNATALEAPVGCVETALGQRSR